MLKHKLSISKFASQANISKSHLHGILHLNRLPTFDIVIKICKTYPIYPPDLFRVPEKQQLSVPKDNIRLNVILHISIEAMTRNSDK